MKHPYDDIIDLPHHVSERHPQMSMYNRAAQFAPFAALTGHDAAITEFILQHIKDYILVEIVYFEPDGKKAGGSYRTKSGFIKESDPLAGTLEMDDGSLIPIRHIRDIKGDCFEE